MTEGFRGDGFGKEVVIEGIEEAFRLALVAANLKLLKVIVPVLRPDESDGDGALYFKGRLFVADHIDFLDMFQRKVLRQQGQVVDPKVLEGIAGEDE